jgi:hypothetical protein
MRETRSCFLSFIYTSNNARATLTCCKNIMMVSGENANDENGRTTIRTITRGDNGKPHCGYDDANEYNVL